MTINNNQEAYLRLDDVRIEQVDLIVGTQNNPVRIPLTNHYSLIEISENIFQNNISGVIASIDAINLPTNVPITGNELLEITFYTPTVGNKVTLMFAVDKLTDSAPLQNKQSQMYDIHFVCPTYLLNILNNINRSFDGNISQIVESIFKEYISPEPDNYVEKRNKKVLLSVEPTYGRNKIIIPGWNPLVAINWLTKRAVSENNDSSANYVFYQDLDGFHFVSIDSMFNKPPVGHYIFGETDSEDAIRGGMMESINVDATLSNIRKLKVCGFDRSKEAKKGTYASSLLLHDLVYKRYNNFTYNSFQDQGNRPMLNPHPAYNSVGVYNIAVNGKHYFSSIHKWLHETGEETDVNMIPKTGNDNVEIWLQRHDAQKLQLLSNSIEFEVSGDSTKRVGDVVSVTIPSLEGVDSSGNMKLDGYLCGNYLITEIRHRIAKGNKGHTMRLKLCKESLIDPTSPLTSFGESNKGNNLISGHPGEISDSGIKMA